ncbi:unnamed protein product [Closterium sp. NIES-54]
MQSYMRHEGTEQHQHQQPETRNINLHRHARPQALQVQRQCALDALTPPHESSPSMIPPSRPGPQARKPHLSLNVPSPSSLPRNISPSCPPQAPATCTAAASHGIYSPGPTSAPAGPPHLPPSASLLRRASAPTLPEPQQTITAVLSSACAARASHSCGMQGDGATRPRQEQQSEQQKEKEQRNDRVRPCEQRKEHRGSGDTSARDSQPQQLLPLTTDEQWERILATRRKTRRSAATRISMDCIEACPIRGRETAAAIAGKRTPTARGQLQRSGGSCDVSRLVPSMDARGCDSPPVGTRSARADHDGARKGCAAATSTAAGKRSPRLARSAGSCDMAQVVQVLEEEMDREERDARKICASATGNAAGKRSERRRTGGGAIVPGSGGSCDMARLVQMLEDEMDREERDARRNNNNTTNDSHTISNNPGTRRNEELDSAGGSCVLQSRVPRPAGPSRCTSPLPSLRGNEGSNSSGGSCAPHSSVARSRCTSPLLTLRGNEGSDSAERCAPQSGVTRPSGPSRCVSPLPTCNSRNSRNPTDECTRRGPHGSPQVSPHSFVVPRKATATEHDRKVTASATATESSRAIHFTRSHDWDSDSPNRGRSNGVGSGSAAGGRTLLRRSGASQDVAPLIRDQVAEDRTPSLASHASSKHLNPVAQRVPLSSSPSSKGAQALPVKRRMAGRSSSLSHSGGSCDVAELLRHLRSQQEEESEAEGVAHLGRTFSRSVRFPSSISESSRSRAVELVARKGGTSDPKNGGLRIIAGSSESSRTVQLVVHEGGKGDLEKGGQRNGGRAHWRSKSRDSSDSSPFTRGEREARSEAQGEADKQVFPCTRGRSRVAVDGNLANLRCSSGSCDMSLHSSTITRRGGGGGAAEKHTNQDSSLLVRASTTAAAGSASTVHNSSISPLHKSNIAVRNHTLQEHHHQRSISLSAAVSGFAPNEISSKATLGDGMSRSLVTTADCKNSFTNKSHRRMISWPSPTPSSLESSSHIGVTHSHSPRYPDLDVPSSHMPTTGNAPKAGYTHITPSSVIPSLAAAAAATAASAAEASRETTDFTLPQPQAVSQVAGSHFSDLSEDSHSGVSGRDSDSGDQAEDSDDEFAKLYWKATNHRTAAAAALSTAMQHLGLEGSGIVAPAQKHPQQIFKSTQKSILSRLKNTAMQQLGLEGSGVKAQKHERQYQQQHKHEHENSIQQQRQQQQQKQQQKQQQRRGNVSILRSYSHCESIDRSSNRSSSCSGRNSNPCAPVSHRDESNSHDTSSISLDSSSCTVTHQAQTGTHKKSPRCRSFTLGDGSSASKFAANDIGNTSISTSASSNAAKTDAALEQSRRRSILSSDSSLSVGIKTGFGSQGSDCKVQSRRKHSGSSASQAELWEEASDHSRSISSSISSSSSSSKQYVTLLPPSLSNPWASQARQLATTVLPHAPTSAIALSCPTHNRAALPCPQSRCLLPSALPAHERSACPQAPLRPCPLALPASSLRPACALPARTSPALTRTLPAPCPTALMRAAAAAVTYAAATAACAATAATKRCCCCCCCMRCCEPRCPALQPARCATLPLGPRAALPLEPRCSALQPASCAALPLGPPTPTVAPAVRATATTATAIAAATAVATTTLALLLLTAIACHGHCHGRSSRGRPGGGGYRAGGAGQQRQPAHPDTLSPQQIREWVVQRGRPGGGGCGFMGTGQRRQQRQQEIFSPQQLRDYVSHRGVPRCVEAAALGASESDAALGASESAAALGGSASTVTGPASAEVLHTFTLDSGASRCFFRDCTTVTPLAAPIPISLADPTGGPVVVRASTVL